MALLYKYMIGVFFIGMTIAKDIGMANVRFLKIDKTEEERAEEKTKYNSFMSFMADIVLKYGLNEKIDGNK